MSISFNEIKKLIGSNDQWNELVTVMASINKKNPYSSGSDEYIMWNEQCNVNLPLLYIASIYLYIYAKKNGCKIFLFATRDCCHWYNIFKKLFPNENCHYFNCSRNMFSVAYRDSHPIFKNYVQSLVNDNMASAIYVDIHGSGQHLFKYLKKEFKDSIPHCFLLSSGCIDISHIPSQCKKYVDKICYLIFNEKGGHVEMLNYDVVGTLQNFNEDGPIRDKPEYSMNQIIPYHKTMSAIINKLLPLNPHCHLDGSYNSDELHELIKKLFAVIQKDRPIIGKFIHHIGRHKKLIKDKPKKKDK